MKRACMVNPLRVCLMTAKMSPASGGLSVSVPGLAHGVDVFDDIEMHTLGTQDPSDPGAAMAWGQRAQAFPVTAPVSLQRAPAMKSALEQLNPDVVDVQGLWTWSSRLSLDYWRRYGKAYIITPRGMLDPWARRNSAWKKRLFSFYAESAHLRNVYCLRATAGMEAEHFRNMGLHAPIAIVPNAISVPELLPRPYKESRQVLFLSRIHPKKGIDILLNAWSKLEERHPGWVLVIAGIDENGHEAELKSLAKRLNLKRVSFPGPVHGAAKDALYRQSDLFVLPTYTENFGLVVAEALAQEVPVITTKNAPWSGLKDNQCGWWISLDQDKLVATMKNAMTLPREELWSMGVRGRTWIKKDFSHEKVSSMMRDVYLWCAGRSEKPEHVYK